MMYWYIFCYNSILNNKVEWRWVFNYQIKAKTEMLLSAEAAKTAQRADLESHLETAQHALQDKQQVNNQYSTSPAYTNSISIIYDCLALLMAVHHLWFCLK